MKKNVTQDIVPAKRSIRDVELPSKAKEDVRKVSKSQAGADPFTRPVTIHTSPKETPVEDFQPIKIESMQRPPAPPVPPAHDFKYTYSEPKKSNKKFLIIGGVVVLAVLAFALSAIFKSATITVTPIVQSKSIDEKFVAKKDVSTGSDLGYQVVTVTKDLEQNVDPKDVTSEQKVEKKAGGTIVIYNNFGVTPLKLVATTRFQTPEGLIFRLSSAVTVPGKYTKDGKSVPGSIEAQVVADQAGANYNIGLKDFTVPGLKTDAAKYKTIYARSKSEMTGGFSGLQKVVTKDVLLKVETDMETALKNSLSRDVVAQIPADFVLFTGSLTFRFEPGTTAGNSAGATVVKKKGVVSAIIFDKKTLTKSILSKVLPDANSDLIKITNLDNLNFVLATSSIQSVGSTISFNLKGDANFVWVIDESRLKTDLLGLSKSNANTVMSAYPSIKEAWILTRPFWNTTIPSDPKKVTIVNTLENMQ